MKQERRGYSRRLVGFGLAVAILFGLAGPTSSGSALAAGEPTLSINPQLFDFNYVAIGSQSSPLTFTIKNRGSGPAAMGTVGMIGDAPEQYVVASEDCASRKLAALATCTVAVRFRPTAAGNHMATLQVEADSGQTRLAFMLGSAKSRTAPPGSGSPKGTCVKAKKSQRLAQQKVRQTKRKLWATRTKSKRQAIRKRMVRQQRTVKRLKAYATLRCDRVTG